MRAGGARAPRPPRAARAPHTSNSTSSSAATTQAAVFGERPTPPRRPWGGVPPPSLPRGLKSLRRGRLWSPMIRACGVKVPALSSTKGDVLLRIRWDVLFLVK